MPVQFSVLSGTSSMLLYKFPLTFCLLFLFTFEWTCANRLSVSGKKLMYNGKSVFLSGVNFAWNSYGYDFGNGKYTANSKSTFEKWLKDVASKGGNSVRKFLFLSLVTVEHLRLTYQFQVCGFMWKETTLRSMMAPALLKHQTERYFPK